VPEPAHHLLLGSGTHNDREVHEVNEVHVALDERQEEDLVRHDVPVVATLIQKPGT
jgi:hypothetical protein